VVQGSDWLSQVADKFLGDPLLFPAIAEATNQMNAVDSSFAKVVNPNVIEPGWKLCLPAVEGVAPQVSGDQEAAEGLSSDVLKNMEYKSDWTKSGKAKLINREYREPAAPGSVQRPTSAPC